MVSALIWGGNVGEAAVRGAAWGTTSGAVSGAIVGSRQDRTAAQKERLQAEKKLKEELGEDGFAGLWLEAITYRDQGDTAEAGGILDEIVDTGWKDHTREEVEIFSDEAYQGLINIRKRENMPTKCTS